MWYTPNMFISPDLEIYSALLYFSQILTKTFFLIRKLWDIQLYGSSNVQKFCMVIEQGFFLCAHFCQNKLVVWENLGDTLT